jgi:transcriptional regulator with XRE-family HTH domain
LVVITLWPASDRPTPAGGLRPLPISCHVNAYWRRQRGSGNRAADEKGESMADGPRQVVKRRRLRAELRNARQQADLTQDQVADAMEWSPSKIIRIEAGSVGVSANDMKELLRLYNITDTKRLNELLTLAREARERLTTYRDAPPKLLQFIDYEAAASAIHMFQTVLVPGILQTEEYARTVIQAVMPKSSKAQVEALVKVRMSRQEALTRPDPVELIAVVDEAVVRRQVGGEGAMRRQIKHLVEVSGRGNVTLEVVRFEAGVHPGVQGPFVIFEFPDAEDDDVLYLESSRGDLIIRDEPDELAAYEERFDALRRLSPGRDGSLAFLESVAAGDG